MPEAHEPTDNTPPAETPVASPTPPPNPLRRIALVVVLVTATLFVLSILMERSTPSTSQAVVQGYVVQMASEVGGRVVEIAVLDNARVTAGQLLFRIDPQPYKIAVAEAEARLEQTGQALGANTASVDAAQAQADVAKNATGYSTLLADADGVVVDTLAEPGQVVGAGQVVVRVAHSGQREAVIQLPETLRPALGSVATVALYGQNQRAGSARLRQLADSADRQTRTFEARYVLDGALSSATLGSTISVAIADTDGVDARELQVPMGALYDAGKGPGVWVVGGEPQQVAWRPIQVRSLNNEGSVRVTGDLRVGDRVVALGAHLLNEGDKVRTEPAGATQKAVVEVSR